MAEVIPKGHYDLRPYDDPRFGLTEFVVKGNSFEVYTLWAECQRDGVPWKQEKSVLMQVGRVNDMPVVISVRWEIIDGLRVLFWEPSSRMVDNQMIEEWFDHNCCPKWDNGTRIARTNAMNFPDVRNEARERREGGDG